MTRISASNKPSGATPEISTVAPSASEVTSLDQQSHQPSPTQTNEQSSPRFSEKEVKSRVTELKMANQVRESELRSQAPLSPGTSNGAKETLKQTTGKDVQAEKMMASSQKMQEMNMSFNMQYLMLQQDMQNENRKMTTLSNIMETKHETAKNSIKKVR